MKVLVTGGSRGIGKEICSVYKENGHEVFAPTRAELDLTSTDSINTFVSRYGEDGFTAVVNNAGINPVNWIEDVKESDLMECMHVNLIAPALLLKGFVPFMKRRKNGYIVNIGSLWSVVSKPGRAVYAMSKNGIHGLTNTLAVELGEYGILVNTVCPGFINTDMSKATLSPAEREALCEDVPLGRFGETREVADLVYYLASEKNSYITGQKIAIDGGFTAR